MTESQVEKNKINLINLFELAKKVNPETLKERIKDEYKTIKYWYYHNIYYPYKMRLEDLSNRNAMKDEFAKVLENTMVEYEISKEELLDTKGNLERLVMILQSKQKEEKKEQNEFEDKTLEELIEIQNKLINEKIKLERKLTPRMRSMYEPNQINEYEQQLEECKSKLKKISKEIENKKKNKSETIIEIRNDEKIDEVSNSYEQKIKCMDELHNQHVKKLEEKNKEKDEIIKSLQQKNQTMENTLEQRIMCLKKQKDIILNEQKEIRKQVKEELITLLLKNNNFSYNTIKDELDYPIDIETYKSIMSEIKEQIPGIIEQFENDGYNNKYKLANKALHVYNNYSDQKPQIQICNQNINNKTLKFIVRSDSHINLDADYDEIMKQLEPYFELSSNHKDAPIIDLGDIADTYNYFNYNELYNSRDKKVDVETLKVTYNFFKNYAKSLAQMPETNHYILFGNHDIDPFYAGVDPINVIKNYSPNFRYLGLLSGNLKIKNINVGLFHGILPENKTRIGLNYKYESSEFNERINELSKEHELMLVGHYHQKRVYLNTNTVLVDNGTKTATLLTVNINDNQVESISLELLSLSEKNRFTDIPLGYPIIFYPKSKQKTF